MQSVQLIIIGGGEHARVVGEAAQCALPAFHLIGFVDPEPCPETENRLGIARLGDDSVIPLFPEARLILALAAIHHIARRAEVVRRIARPPEHWATVTHGFSWISPTATVAEGVVLMAGVVVQSGAHLSAHCTINSGAVIEHDVMIEEHAHVAPGAVVAGTARIGANAFIGAGAIVRDHVRVGENAIVGMGAVVVSNVAAGQRVKGVPAR